MMRAEDLLKTKVGQLPGNREQLEIKPGKYHESPSALENFHPTRHPRQVGRGELNKTEERYLDWLHTLGDKRIWVQAIGLKLGPKAFYYPDFAALDDYGIRFIDVKGVWKGHTEPHIEDDALVKIKWAAQLYAPCRFLIAWWDKDSSTWKHREIRGS